MDQRLRILLFAVLVAIVTLVVWKGWPERIDAMPPEAIDRDEFVEPPPASRASRRRLRPIHRPPPSKIPPKRHRGCRPSVPTHSKDASSTSARKRAFRTHVL